MDGAFHFVRRPASAKKTVARKSYRPKTPLGMQLMKLRQKAIAKGLILVDADNVLEDVKRRRGKAGYGAR